MNKIWFSIDGNGVVGRIAPAIDPFGSRAGEDLVGKNLLDIIHAEDKKRVSEKIKACIKKGAGPSFIEARYLVGPGKAGWAYIYLRPSVTGDNSRRIDGFLADITARRAKSIRNRSMRRLIGGIRMCAGVNECIQLALEAISGYGGFEHCAYVERGDESGRWNIIFGESDGDFEGRISILLEPNSAFRRKIEQVDPDLSGSYIIRLEPDGNSPAGSRSDSTGKDDGASRHAIRNVDLVIAPVFGMAADCVGWIVAGHLSDESNPFADAPADLEETAALVSFFMARTEIEAELKLQFENMREKDIVLKEVMATFADEKTEIRNRIKTELDRAIFPALARLVDEDGKIDSSSREFLKKSLELLADQSIAEKSPLSNLSSREIQICRLIKDGASSGKIAKILGISSGTVRKHRESIRRKLDLVHSNVNLTTFLKNAENI